MNVNGTPTRSIWPLADQHTVRIIDQTVLPHHYQTLDLNSLEDRVMICGSPEMLRDLKALCEHRDFEEGSTSRPGDFVIERAFVGN